MEIRKRIHASEVDFEIKMTLFAVANTVQNMVTETLDLMGCDNITLRTKYHSMWVFSKSKFICKRLPVWGEWVTVKCKSVMAKRLTNVMSVEFIDEEGNLIIECYVETCVIDIESFRFVKLTDIPFEYPSENIEVKFPMEELVCDEAFPVTVNAANIDYSIHLNNTQSILMYLSTLSTEDVHTIFGEPFVFTVKYNAQARLGDEIVLKRGSRDGVYGYAIEKSDGKNVVSARIERS
ncbi:MAG: hypothetical protein J1F39_00030 [Clostridiales bacterium]|nr:hypothetical protein [Clostridiales bacterium]